MLNEMRRLRTRLLCPWPTDSPAASRARKTVPSRRIGGLEVDSTVGFEDTVGAALLRGGLCSSRLARTRTHAHLADMRNLHAQVPAPSGGQSAVRMPGAAEAELAVGAGTEGGTTMASSAKNPKNFGKPLIFEPGSTKLPNFHSPRQESLIDPMNALAVFAVVALARQASAAAPNVVAKSAHRRVILVEDKM